MPLCSWNIIFASQKKLCNYHWHYMFELRLFSLKNIDRGRTLRSKTGPEWTLTSFHWQMEYYRKANKLKQDDLWRSSSIGLAVSGRIRKNFSGKYFDLIRNKNKFPRKIPQLNFNLFKWINYAFEEMTSSWWSYRFSL